MPDLYVQIVPPQNLVLNGVPSNRIGVVGTATWGPVGTPVIVGNMADYARNFGAVQNRTYDMGTTVAVAVQQGAQDFRCVRVSDGTHASATATMLVSGITLTAVYPGTLGNTITAALATGSKASTFKLTVSIPGQVPEVFDNIAGTLGTFWTNLLNAVNSGQSALRGPSQLVVASANGTVAVSATSVTFTSGTDGITGITTGTTASAATTILLGADTGSRTGMYALRNSGCSLLVLSDAVDTASMTTIDGFAASEGMYAIQALPAGTTVAGAVTAKASAALDSWTSKLLHGDWVYWIDSVNGVTRMVSPQGFAAGRLSNLSPEQSGLNKPIYAIAGTQKTGAIGQTAQDANYTTADLTALGQVGIDVIANPSVGGTYYSLRFGHNSSSNAAINGDNYTRMTNYIAATLQAGMGKYVGELINSGLFRRVRGTLLGFLGGMLQQKQLGSTDGSLPYSVVCDVSNNPDIRTSLGYLQADVQVKYQAINEKFLVNLEGGQTVQVQRQTVPAGQTA